MCQRPLILKSVTLCLKKSICLMPDSANMEGNALFRESVADMEQDATLGIDFCEYTKGHAVPRRGLRGVGLLNRFSCLKLIGISLVAHQLPTAAAESICRAFNSVGGTLDLIGVVSAFGTSAATKSLRYSALNDNYCYATGHIGPGGLSLAAALYQASDFELAWLLAFGGSTEDSSNPAKLDSTEGLRYIGLQSNSECPVGNAVGESIMLEHEALWSQSESEKRVGRDANRPTKVILLSATEDPSNPVKFVSLKAEWSGLILGWLPLALTVAVIVSCCFCKLWFVAGLILFGTLSMMVAVLVLRHLCHFEYSEPRMSESSRGDASPCYILVVGDKDPNVLNVVMAAESTLQKLFQRQIVFQSSSGKYILFLAASMLYIYVLASVLLMSNVSTSGQIHFAIANIIGVVADMAKASQNTKLALAKKALQQFTIKAICKPIVFGNRTAAVAFVAKHAHDPGMLKSKKILPCDGKWQEWWKVLEERRRPQGENGGTALPVLLEDMEDGLGEEKSCHGENVAADSEPDLTLAT